jgi:uncharacterized membrane protein YfcA
MPDILASALATYGLMWIALGSLLAGLVRGFAGFGTAMIYLPFAGQFLTPLGAVMTLMVIDGFGPLPALPRAVREADWTDLRRLILGMFLCMTIGIWLLLTVPVDVFRGTVSLISLALLAALIFGVRYSGRLSPPKVYGIGAAGGVLGGALGLAGPPVILLYMASTHAPAVIRATTMVFLFAFDVIFFGMVGVQGLLSAATLVLGAVLIAPMMLGILIGTWLFRPAYETVYRTVAYVIIGVSALYGLPIWG